MWAALMIKLTLFLRNLSLFFHLVRVYTEPNTPPACLLLYSLETWRGVRTAPISARLLLIRLFPWQYLPLHNRPMCARTCLVVHGWGIPVLEPKSFSNSWIEEFRMKSRIHKVRKLGIRNILKKTGQFTLHRQTQTNASSLQITARHF